MNLDLDLDAAINNARKAVESINDGYDEVLAELAKRPGDEGLNASLSQLEKERGGLLATVARLEAAQVVAARIAEQDNNEAAHVAMQETLSRAIAAELKRVTAAQNVCKALKPFASAYAEYLATSEAAFTASKAALRYKAKSTAEFLSRLEMLRQRDDAPLALMLLAAGFPFGGDYLVLRPPGGLKPNLQALEQSAQLRADKLAGILGRGGDA